MDWRRCEQSLFPKVDAVDDPQDMEHPAHRVSLISVMALTTDDSREFICGWGAAVINVAVTYPLNKIIFRQVSRLFISSLS